jgi:hypothetical protein
VNGPGGGVLWVWACSCGNSGVLNLEPHANLGGQVKVMVQEHLSEHLPHPDPSRYSVLAGPAQVRGKLRKPAAVVDWEA